VFLENDSSSVHDIQIERPPTKEDILPKEPETTTATKKEAFITSKSPFNRSAMIIKDFAS